MSEWVYSEVVIRLRLLQCLIMCPDLMDEAFEQLTDEDFADEDSYELYLIVKNDPGLKEGITDLGHILNECVSRLAQRYVADLVLRKDAPESLWRDSFDVYMRRIALFRTDFYAKLRQEKKELIASGDPVEVARGLTRLRRKRALWEQTQKAKQGKH